MGIGNKYAQGFTLLELLVVIALISVIFAVLSVSFSDNSRHVRATALELEIALKKTRLEAMLQGRSTQFAPLEDQSGYALYSGQEVMSEQVFKVDGMHLDLLKADHIRFYPNGRSNGADIKLSFQETVVHLTVDPLTGLVQAQ